MPRQCPNCKNPKWNVPREKKDAKASGVVRIVDRDAGGVAGSRGVDRRPDSVVPKKVQGAKIEEDDGYDYSDEYRQ